MSPQKYVAPEVDWARYNPNFLVGYLGNFIERIAEGTQHGTALSAARGRLDDLADADTCRERIPSAAAEERP